MPFAYRESERETKQRDRETGTWMVARKTNEYYGKIERLE